MSGLVAVSCTVVPRMSHRDVLCHSYIQTHMFYFIHWRQLHRPPWHDQPAWTTCAETSGDISLYTETLGTLPKKKKLGDLTGFGFLNFSLWDSFYMLNLSAFVKIWVQQKVAPWKASNGKFNNENPKSKFNRSLLRRANKAKCTSVTATALLHFQQM